MVARRPPEDAPVFVPASSIDRVALRGLDEFLRKPYVRVNAPPVGVGAATTQDAGAKAESKTYAPPPPSAGTAPPSGGNPNPFPPIPTKKDTRAAATALNDTLVLAFIEAYHGRPPLAPFDGRLHRCAHALARLAVVVMAECEA